MAKESKEREEIMLLEISKEDFIELENSRRILEHLDANGVDNWAGYDISDVELVTIEELEESLEEATGRID